MNKLLYFRGGFTLFEVIIYITLLTILSVSSIHFLFSIHIQDQRLFQELNSTY
jgi:type II secretory pathway component PulJ